MVKEIGVAYYGVLIPQRAREDFRTIRKLGCNSVLLAISEFDAWFWYKNVIKLIHDAKEIGLRVYLDLWGWGKVFGGEPPSIFLQNFSNFRQISSKNRKLPIACFNTVTFRNYILGYVKKLSKETEVDYIFLDEPHYAVNPLVKRGEWTCLCETCRNLFRKEYGLEMPIKMDDKVMSFRQRKIVEFISDISKIVKNFNKDVCVCLLPQFSLQIGILDWEQIASIEQVDMISTDPYWISFKRNIKWFEKIMDHLIYLSKKFNKKTQIWFQAFRVPAGREKEILDGVRLANNRGIDSIFVWPYNAGKGSILASERPIMLWKMVGELFKEIQKTS
jgi:hypothetical protein